MYTTSTTVSSRIESYCRTWRMWLENDESVIMGDNIMSATSDVQSTSLSDDIELGAVCSQSWALQINDAETRFLGKEYDLSLYLADLTGVTTYSTLEAYTYAELSKLTVEQISKLGEVLDGERIPLGRFTCVKSKKSGGNTEVTFADRLYFSDKVYKPTVTLPAWSKAIEDDICKQLGLQNGNDYTKPAKLRVKGGARLYGKGHIRLKTANFDFKISSIPKDTTMRQMLSYIASAQGEFGLLTDTADTSAMVRLEREDTGQQHYRPANTGRTSEYPCRHCLQGQRQRNSAAGQHHRLGRACAGV